MYDDAVVYSLDACEFALKPTGILDGRGRMIYAKPVVGFARPLKEYVVKEDETDAPARAGSEVADGCREGGL